MERSVVPLKSMMAAALLLWLATATATATSTPTEVNMSTSAADMPFWSTATTAKELEDEQHQFDGGFSSLDGMLQWAVGHSDPVKLKETAQGVQRLSQEELKKGQMDIKELIEKLKMPTDAELMKIAIDDLSNISLPLENRHRALQELLILVEPIDNANDLHKLGGLTAVVTELNNPNPEIRSISAWILGKASQNNPVVQNQILELGTLPKLMEMTHSSSVEEATKALYTISSLVRDNLHGQDLFYKEAGDVMIQNILSNSSVDIRLRRKSVFILADLIQSHLDFHENKAERPIFSNHVFLKSVVDLIASTDLDLQEKALYAVKNLLMLRYSDALVFKEVCELDVMLRRMKQQLEQLIDDKYKEYAMDVESLRREVELLFLEKLDKFTQLVPT